MTDSFSMQYPHHHYPAPPFPRQPQPPGIVEKMQPAPDYCDGSYITGEVFGVTGGKGTA